MCLARSQAEAAATVSEAEPKKPQPGRHEQCHDKPNTFEPSADLSEGISRRTARDADAFGDLRSSHNAIARSFRLALPTFMITLILE